MKALCRESSLKNAPSEILRLGFSPDCRTGVSKDKEYEVFAVSHWRGELFLQVIDDTNAVAWLPAFLFEMRSAEMQSDWVLTLMSGELKMVLGPRFVATDEESYRRMVEADSDSMRIFWERAKR